MWGMVVWKQEIILAAEFIGKVFLLGHSGGVSQACKGSGLLQSNFFMRFLFCFTRKFCADVGVRTTLVPLSSS